MADSEKPLILITGAGGKLGSSLSQALSDDYQVIASDRPGAPCDIEMDITSQASVEKAVASLKQRFGNQLAAVIHLAAFFDFSGDESPLYDAVNVKGTRLLLQSLQSLQVEQFIYTSTMLIHEPTQPGEKINEQSPDRPKWAYPKSKAETEAIIKQHCGQIPYAIIRLAGIYDERTAVPTLAHQIARIYERTMKSHLYAGNSQAGQAFIHRDDMISLVKSLITKRAQLPEKLTLLAGEPNAYSYDYLQNKIGKLIHGEAHWKTLVVPKPAAQLGAWLEEHGEHVIPDQLDKGEQPFIKPFMIAMASDHYDLDISRANDLLDWTPQHSIDNDIEHIVAALRENPQRWYQENHVNPPDWLEAASDTDENAESIRQNYDHDYRRQHQQNIWAPLLNSALGAWLMMSPILMAQPSPALVVSDTLAGALVLVLSLFALSPNRLMRIARWAVAATGLWVCLSPLVFWAPTSASYLNSTLVGALIIGFSLLVRPFPGGSPVAMQRGPIIPPGWDFSPSDWLQRMPIILLAFIGLFISMYLTAYQLGHINSVWDPFFSGATQPNKNGSEDIITSSVSEAWPVPDAGLGAATYLLEILTGIIGSRARWRTMPWLVLLFGFMIIPLGAVSITFIIIQPIIIGTWCTLCLVAAAAMLLQIPYSFDEIVASVDFLRRKAKQGRPWMLIIFTGDTDITTSADKTGDKELKEFDQPISAVFKSMYSGGISFPPTLLVCAAIGIWLMFTRLALGTQGQMANSDHLIGALIVTVTVTAFSEVMRPLRYLNCILAIALYITTLLYAASVAATVVNFICATALIIFSLPQGNIRSRYGSWDKILNAAPKTHLWRRST